MNQRHKHYDIIVAWAEGKQIQRFNANTSEWVDLRSMPSFSMYAEYRVKPVTITIKYRLALFFNIKGDDSYEVLSVSSESLAKAWHDNPKFIRWLTDWQEVEV